MNRKDSDAATGGRLDAQARRAEQMGGRGIRRGRVLPIVVLALLPTLVAELTFGSTTLSDLQGLVLEVPLYGAGALLVRETVRRRGGSWPSLLLLGAAYGAVEEGVLEPTWFMLQHFQAHPFGVAAGVYWPYALFNMGYHAVWSITLPILLTEALFPERRHQPWLGRLGIGVASVVYLAAAVATWVLWRAVLAPRVFHLPPAQPLLLAAAALLAVLLVITGIAACTWWRGRGDGTSTTSRPRPTPPWTVYIGALVGGFAWFIWFFVPDRFLRSWVPLPVVLVVDTAIVVIAAAVARRWSNSPGWGRPHLLALYTGALTAHMIGGLKIYTYQLTGMDLAFTLVIDVATLAALALLVRRSLERSRLQVGGGAERR